MTDHTPDYWPAAQLRRALEKLGKWRANQKAKTTHERHHTPVIKPHASTTEDPDKDSANS